MWPFSIACHGGDSPSPAATPSRQPSYSARIRGDWRSWLTAVHLAPAWPLAPLTSPPSALRAPSSANLDPLARLPTHFPLNGGRLSSESDCNSLSDLQLEVCASEGLDAARWLLILISVGAAGIFSYLAAVSFHVSEGSIEIFEDSWWQRAVGATNMKRQSM